MRETRICGVCGNKVEPGEIGSDPKIIGKVYCTKHDQKVQMVGESHINQRHLDIMELRHGESIELGDIENSSTEDSEDEVDE